MIQTPIRRTVDLAKGLRLEPLGLLLGEGDSRGDVLRLKITSGGTAVDLTGASVTAYFIRADDTSVLLEGSIDGGEAVLELDDSCYALPGRFSMAVALMHGGARNTVYACEGAVARTHTDAVVDPGEVIPSLDALLAKVSELEQLTDHVRQQLNSGAFDGKGLVILGYYNTLAELEAAVTAPERGDAYGVGSAGAYDIYTWDAVNYRWVNNGAVTSAPGKTPVLTIGTVVSGDTADASITGTAENPMLNLVLPKGDKGDVADLAPVATSGSYNDLTDKPTPAFVLIENKGSGYLDTADRIACAASAWTTVASFEVEFPRTAVYLMTGAVGVTSTGSTNGSGHMRIQINGVDAQYPNAQGWGIPPKSNIFTGAQKTDILNISAGTHTISLGVYTTVATQCYGYRLQIAEVQNQ